MQIEDNELLFSLIIAFGALCIWLLLKLRAEKKEREKIADENRKLIADNVLLEGEHLKFQLQPHTLRNMVGALHIAAKNLHKGSEALADTLDYILYQDKKHLVSVEDELEFIESYKSLQGNFVYQTNSIKIEKSGIDTSSKYFKTACIPHLITAYFIENAFKHGDINHPEFLTIRIKLSNQFFELTVINRFKHKPSTEKGGLGLSNMRKRLNLLHSGKYEIKNSCNEQEYHSTLIIHF